MHRQLESVRERCSQML
uniref:Uncharacterized protein n=1 Tax=Anguilla anguilla TaxID=7936 RepID=A0A0E9TF16_ANGAN